MPHELLEWEEIFKKTNYYPCDPIATMFSAVKKTLDFADITRTSYTKLQAVNIAYMIIHRTGKFGLLIREWSHMLEIEKT